MFESFVILKTSFKGLILFRMQRNFSMDDELKLIRHMQTLNQYIGTKSVEFKIKAFLLYVDLWIAPRRIWLRKRGVQLYKIYFVTL